MRNFKEINIRWLRYFCCSRVLVKHDNLDLQKAIKVGQRAPKRSMDDPADLETKSHKRKQQALVAGCKYTLPDVRVNMYEWFIKVRGSLKGPLTRSLYKSKCQSVTVLD